MCKYTLLLRDCNIAGQDSIGATLFCGKEKVERIFWCGSIVTHTDKNLHPYFTPTIIQVAAGVLSGLSYIIEKPRLGWLQPSDIDTTYMLAKCKPNLHPFFVANLVCIFAHMLAPWHDTICVCAKLSGELQAKFAN